MEISPANILSLHDLSAGYRMRREQKILVSRISYSTSAGKIIALMGANGSGKTTLLKTITGSIKPISGKVIIRDENIADHPVKDLARLISIVTSRADLYSPVDVYSFVALGRIPYTGLPGVLHESDHHKISDAIEKTGIADLSNRLVNSLSDGERQRVLIARAIAQETPLVVMDEPTAFLDIINRKKIMQVIRQLAETTRRTFIISTHEATLALEFSHEILFIHEHELHVAHNRADAEKKLGEIFGV